MVCFAMQSVARSRIVEVTNITILGRLWCQLRVEITGLRSELGYGQTRERASKKESTRFLMQATIMTETHVHRVSEFAWA